MKTKEKIVERLLEEKNITTKEAVILLKETTPFNPYVISPPQIDYGGDQVPYHVICGCEVCNCIMPNKMVDRRTYEGGNWINNGSNITGNLNQEWSNK